MHSRGRGFTKGILKLGKKASSVNPELSSELDESAQIARSVSDELRTTSYLLHPPLLDEMDLQAGLRWYIDGFKGRSNIKVSFNLPKNLERLPTDLELMIFRVVQECLANVHSPLREPFSNNLFLQLKRKTGHWRFEIKARGCPLIDSSR
jgi:two-component system, NarL family, sensor kinase